MYSDPSAILHRAETVWPLGTVPYDQGQAADCSAFVSAVLGIPRQNTVTLVSAGYIRPLRDGETMQPADFAGECGPGTEGDAGHVTVVETVMGSAFTTIEQHGPNGYLGPERVYYSELPADWTVYRVNAPTEDDMVLEIPRDHQGVMWIARDRIDRRPLINDEDVLYYLGRGAEVPEQTDTADNGAPCVTDIHLFGVDVSGATPLDVHGAPVLDPDALAAKVAAKVGDELAARLRA